MKFVDALILVLSLQKAAKLRVTCTRVLETNKWKACKHRLHLQLFEDKIGGKKDNRATEAVIVGWALAISPQHLEI